MKRKRTVELVLETERRVTLRRQGQPPASLCGRCSGPLVSAEAAVAFTGLSSRAIHRMAEAGDIHFAETPEGVLLVCAKSLHRTLPS